MRGDFKRILSTASSIVERFYNFMATVSAWRWYENCGFVGGPKRARDVEHERYTAMPSQRHALLVLLPRCHVLH